MKKNLNLILSVLIFIIVIVIGQQQLSLSLSDIREDIKKLEFSDTGWIDPYKSNLQTIDPYFNIKIEDITSYGSGSKMAFNVLNVSGIKFKNIELSFELKGDKNIIQSKTLEKKDINIFGDIDPGWARKSEVIFSNTKPEDIKMVNVSYINGAISYKLHE